MRREPISQTLADNLVRLIREHGTTASALALKCGFSQSAIHDIINGRSANPKVSTVGKIAETLGVPFAELFLSQEQIQAEGEMLRAYHSLPPDEQRKLALVARAWQLDKPGS
ncbi:helix-turn-helix domain-containing protein [Cereibacter sphaeroides]|uniref:helix-turn-helix domain-containing protein n=1 Tax=Cereibacter sphaeroides TaxID=1063 RepID=UPI000E5A4547|nr:helix-turn-helix transcriptional regulator [Cereibacter sphaeroides]AZB54459.1 helix-turn-helix domain-containing protein [Cereibacter sphaeroides]AZB58733.1 helix-turn-helix domain-containing protein [Cereibacter sphaeroides]RIA01361.1 XRE family transcriptional regulator [Cereibacter sphaeroides]